MSSHAAKWSWVSCDMLGVLPTMGTSSVQPGMQLAECSPSMPKAWVWPPASHKTDVGVHKCNPSSQEVQAGGSSISQSLLPCQISSHSEKKNPWDSTMEMRPRLSGSLCSQGKHLAMDCLCLVFNWSGIRPRFRALKCPLCLLCHSRNFRKSEVMFGFSSPSSA